MNWEEIVTPHLILRKISPQVRKEIHVLSDPEQMKLLGIHSQDQLEKEKKKFEQGLTTHNRTFLYFHLLLKETHEIIGWCGYHTWYTDHDRAEIGYGLFKEEWKGKGYMSEALLPIIDYGFNQMGLFRIEAFIGLDNEPSYRLLKRLHFLKEGHLRKHYRNGDVPEDSLVYALLKSEYSGISSVLEDR